MSGAAADIGSIRLEEGPKKKPGVGFTTLDPAPKSNGDAVGGEPKEHTASNGNDTDARAEAAADGEASGDGDEDHPVNVFLKLCQREGVNRPTQHIADALLEVRKLLVLKHLWSKP
jgi:hypothetical protein